MKPNELLHELKYFEDFLKKIGFKRIEGSVYGYLALSENSLSSEDIQEGLGLSQSAVSNSLKTLTFIRPSTRVKTEIEDAEFMKLPKIA